MTKCPHCPNGEGEHISIRVPWNPAWPATIEHRCPACGQHWIERVHDLAAALTSALESYRLKVVEA